MAAHEQVFWEAGALCLFTPRLMDVIFPAALSLSLFWATFPRVPSAIKASLFAEQKRRQ